MKLKIVSESGRIPEYKTQGAAGFDVSAYTPEGPIVIHPGERKLIHTGLYMEIPEGYEAMVRARSGLALRNGIGLVNGVGTIDCDYRGELMMPIINWGQDDFVINDGDRIVQVVINKFERAEIVEVEALGETERGKKGFGHTGV